MRKELRNTQKRRKRLLKATRRLSADDLRRVLHERAEAVVDAAETGAALDREQRAAAANKKTARGAAAAGKVPR